MTAWTYLALSAAWSVIGYLAGFVMGRSTVAVDVIADAVQNEGGAVSDKEQKVRRRWSLTHVIGVVVLLMGIFTAVQAKMQSDATARLTDCQTAYANGFADALDARSKSTAEAQDALDVLLTTVAGLAPTPESRETFRVALNDYLEKRAAAKRTQAENPYPEPPRDVCKGDS